MADIAGTYQAELIVNNGLTSSLPSTVSITAMQGLLICGDLVSGNIGVAAQVDQYTFDAQANRIVTVTLADASGWGGLTHAVAAVFAPSGTQVVNLDANGQRQLSLPETGTYVVQVRANDFATIGGYGLSLQCRNPAAPATSVTCGALPQGNIAAAAQVDQYTFDGQANRLVTLTLGDVSGWGGLTHAVATLFAPSGTQVVTLDANGQQQITLSETGTYVVQVRASDFATKGGYNLGLECRNPAAAVVAALTCGALPQGNIAAAAQVDQYTFDGQANRVVTLTLADASGWGGLTHAVAALFAPSGTQVINLDANGQRQVTLSETGTYVIQVRASNFVSTGRYGLGLQCGNPAAPATSLSCGALRPGNISAAAQVDQYTFDGQANRIVTLTLADASGWGGLTLTHAVATLFAPSGTQVVNLDANGQRQVTLPEAGTYVVQVRASDFVTTGQYGLSLECRNPAVPATSLSCGALPQGNIAVAAQVDQYTFDGQANRLVTVTLADTSGWGGLTHAVVALFAPSGTQVISLDANGQQQITLSESGMYVAQVRASDFTTKGGYNLGLECRNPTAPVIAALRCGALPQGNIAAAAQVDQYTFDGQASGLVTLTLANTSGWGGLTHAVATLFAPSGTQVVNLDANGQRQITLSEMGTNVVQVRASDFATRGSYSLGLQCP